MKRIHVHVNVADLARSVRYYSTLFGVEPSVQKPEYAKWLLDDPRVNFAISSHGRQPGIDHLGIQTESRPELDEVAQRLVAAEVETIAQEGTTCCYARSDKAWSEDPSGIRWESFYTFGESTRYGEAAPRGENACCAPRSEAADLAQGAACGTPARRPGVSACCL